MSHRRGIVPPNLDLPGFMEALYKMQTFTTRTIREIAIASPETTRVFEEFKIDYCCGGRKPFADACVDAGLDPDIVAEKVAAAIT